MRFLKGEPVYFQQNGRQVPSSQKLNNCFNSCFNMFSVKTLAMVEKKE